MTETYALRNQFWIGNYQMAVHSGSSINTVTSSARLERDIFLHRALIAQGKVADVLDDIADTEATAPQLRAVRALAQFYSDRTRADDCIEAVKALYAQCPPAGDADFSCALVLATIEAERGNVEDALRYCQGENLELQSFAVSLCLRINRIDVAAKKLRAMQKKDEESALTQLSAARVNLYLAADKHKEAQFTFQELVDRFGQSALLLNGLGTAFMLQGNYELAEKAFLDALEKAPNDADTLANLIACTHQSGRPPESADRFLRDLKRSHPDHPYVQELRHLEAEFDQEASKFQARPIEA